MTSEIIDLPSGSIAQKNSLKGRDFFKFQSLASKNAEEALKWVVLKYFTINDQPLDIDTLDDLPFEDVAVLSAEINKVFMPFLNQ
jgi:hypothetical protein